MTPVQDHGNAERPLLSIGLRVTHVGPAWGSRTSACGAPASPPPPWPRATGQFPRRSRPSDIQHQFLQGPDHGPVLFSFRLEDPPPQSHYVLFVSPPDYGVPVENVLGSVHRDGVQHVPRFERPSASAFKGSPVHVSALSGPVAWTGIRPVPRDRRLEGQPCCHESRCLSAAGIRFLDFLSRRGITPLSRSAYPASRPGPRRGFHVPRIRDATGEDAP